MEAGNTVCHLFISLFKNYIAFTSEILKVALRLPQYKSTLSYLNMKN